MTALKFLIYNNSQIRCISIEVSQDILLDYLTRRGTSLTK